MQEPGIRVYRTISHSIPRNYFPGNFKITDWNSLEPFLKRIAGSFQYLQKEELEKMVA
jgi:hypothetical protein